MMSRMDVSSPPGVSTSNITSLLPAFCAESRPCTIYREVAGPIAPLISSTVACGTVAIALALLEAPAGEFELAVWKSGFEAVPRTVEIVADTSVEVEMIRLPEELKVWG